jgi:hypothetical protein
VADSFHTKPLRRFLQTVDRYQVLGLSLDKIRIFEGDCHSLHEIDPAPGVPRTITEALGAELTESSSTVASYDQPPSRPQPWQRRPRAMQGPEAVRPEKLLDVIGLRRR